jgi:cation:H+ antiporter
MAWLDFRGIGLSYNLLIFLVGATVTWVAGHHLAKYADIIAKRTRAGQAFIGILLLGIFVSLPEMVFSSVTAALGNAEIAVNSLLGGVAMVMVMVAVTDVWAGKEPLTSDVDHPVVLLQAGLTILILTLAAAAIATGDRLLPGIGLVGTWTSVIAGIYVLSLLLAKYLQRRHPWTSEDEIESAKSNRHGRRTRRTGKKRRGEEQSSLTRIGALTAAAGIGVVVAGTLLAFSAEALTEQTALGASFIGLIFGGVATSLPELSTSISAVRRKREEMAFADAFGTNLCSTALLFVADLLYPGEPILNQVGQFSIFAVLLGCALTTVYLVGLVVRYRRPVLRMGVESLTVLFAASVGFALLYGLK